MKWLHRPRYSRVEIVVAGLVGFVAAWMLMSTASCIKRPPTPSPPSIDTAADTCNNTTPKGAPQWTTKQKNG